MPTPTASEPQSAPERREGRCHRVPQVIFAPSVLAIVFIALSTQLSWWFLIALPFVYLGSICAQPNLNLADGCLAYLAMILGFILLAFFKPVGIPILLGTVSSYYASAVEKWMRMRPVPASIANESPKALLDASGGSPLMK